MKTTTLLIVLLGGPLFSSVALTQTNSGRPPSQKPETPDLNGIWVTNDGEEVELTHLRSSGHLDAVFEATNKMPNGGCPYGQANRGKYIDGKIVGNVLTGKLEMCTGAEVLVKKCGLGPSTSDFAATVTKDKIMGTRVSEWYRQTTTSDPCKFTHEPARDTNVEFYLTRKEKNQCPDTEEIKKYNEVAERAAKLTELAAKFVKNRDSQMSGALEDSQKALRGISNALNVYIKIGKKCEEIHDVLGDLEEFQNAIDQINHAGCDSSVLARGFDDLFRSAGKLGKKFVKLPALMPMFDILSQNQNFFVKVSGALNPEQRWADQFSGIEGYVPNCP